MMYLPFNSQQKLNQLQNLMMQLIQEKKPHHLPSFLGSPSFPGGANSINNSPRSPFGGHINGHHSHRKKQMLSGSVDSSTLDGVWLFFGLVLVVFFYDSFF